MRTTDQIGVLALVGLVVGAALWPLMVVDGTEHEAYAQALAGVSEANQRLSLDVLRVRMGLVRNFDVLRDDLREVARLHARLAQFPAYLGTAGADALRPDVDELNRERVETAESVNRFASRAAIVKNSLTYLPQLLTATRAALPLASEATTTAAALDDVDKALFGYTATPNPETHAALQRAGAQFVAATAALPPDTFTTHAALLGSHLARLAEYRPLLEAEVARLTAQGAAAPLGRLQRAYLALHAAALQHTLPRWVLVVGAVVAALLVVVTRQAWLAQLAARRLDAELHVGEAQRAELAHATAAAQSANVAKSAFLATMSHEIRTPLNGIIGLTHLVLQTELSDRQRDYLTKIRASGKGLLHIVNDILDFSKIEAGRLDVERAPFDLAASVADVEASLQVGAADKGITFVTHIAADVPRAVRGDRVRLTQILLNLCGNAIKFTQQGTVRMNIAVSAVAPEATTLTLAVSDTGIGLDNEQIANLFIPFSQADASTTRRFGGTGLGLVISRRLAELMGGTITVSSRIGEGSVFTVSVPFVVATLAECAGHLDASAQPLASDSGLAGKRVLLAEDNEINKQIAEELLQSIGVVVEHAENGEVACARMRADFDAVLMDLQMPVLDGLTAARRILAQPQFAHVPIIAMTANAMADDRAAVAAAGMVDFVAKPVEPALLYAALQRRIAPTISARNGAMGPAALQQAVAGAVAGPAAAELSAADLGSTAPTPMPAGAVDAATAMLYRMGPGSTSTECCAGPVATLRWWSNSCGASQTATRMRRCGWQPRLMRATPIPQSAKPTRSRAWRPTSVPARPVRAPPDSKRHLSAATPWPNRWRRCKPSLHAPSPPSDPR